MVEIKALTDGIAVSGQIRREDLPQLVTKFRTIINDRPDSEEVGQPASAEIEAAARCLGLEYRFIPVTPGKLTDTEVGEFGHALAECPRPILAFCRTGTRSTALWALSQAGSRSADEILAAAAAAGYDLEALRARLAAKAATA